MVSQDEVSVFDWSDEALEKAQLLYAASQVRGHLQDDLLREQNRILNGLLDIAKLTPPPGI